MQANTSGQGPQSVVPPEIRGWNWGAFLLNWIWGVGNGTFIALLTFVPLVGFVMPFVLGIKGNEWAWRNRVWRDVEHFKSTQRKWSWAGLAIVVVLIPSCIGIPLMSMKNSDAYALSLQLVRGNAEVIAELGQPMDPGLFVTGSISKDMAGGKAELHYSLSGPKASGDVFVDAVQQGGVWHLREVTLDVTGGKHIDLPTDH